MKVFDKISTVVIVISLFCSFLTSIIFSLDSFNREEIITIIGLLLPVFLTAVKFAYNRHSLTKERILNYVFPFAYYFWLVLSQCGGYSVNGKRRGLAYLFFKNHQMLGAVLYGILFVVLLILIVLKTRLALKRLKENNSISGNKGKIMFLSMILFLVLLIIINAISLIINGMGFIKNGTIFGLLLGMFPFYYWVAYLAFFFKYKISVQTVSFK